MAKQNIYPYGVGGELPSGYPIANNLTTDSAQQALSAAMGKKLSAMTHKGEVFVVAADATAEDKLAADYQCTGTNDELVIQQAINHIHTIGGGKVRLSSGNFNIGSFPNYDSANDGGSYVAILIPADSTGGYSICIEGVYPHNSGTRIHVTESCYESLNANNHYKVFSSTYYADLTAGAKITLMMHKMRIDIPWNQKKIMCIDCHSVNRADIGFIQLSAAKAGYGGWAASSPEDPPAVAAQGCIGLRMTSGSNAGQICDYRSIGTYAFYEGIQVGGEHVVGINLSGICNVYSYTFGNYPWTQAFHHPITLINCCDERSVNMPYFAYCGANRNNGEGGQQISIIDYNLERNAPQTPGKVLGESATELVPGTFHGEVSFTMQVGGTNVTDKKFWKDGHGQRFITRNSAHRLACSTTVRNGYAPNYLQRIWDTTLNKEVVCVDTANKTWKDTMGNTV